MIDRLFKTQEGYRNITKLHSILEFPFSWTPVLND